MLTPKRLECPGAGGEVAIPSIGAAKHHHHHQQPHQLQPHLKTPNHRQKNPKTPFLSSSIPSPSIKITKKLGRPGRFVKRTTTPQLRSHTKTAAQVFINGNHYAKQPCGWAGLPVVVEWSDSGPYMVPWTGWAGLGGRCAGGKERRAVVRCFEERKAWTWKERCRAPGNVHILRDVLYLLQTASALLSRIVTNNG